MEDDRRKREKGEGEEVKRREEREGRRGGSEEKREAGKRDGTLDISS